MWMDVHSASRLCTLATLISNGLHHGHGWTVRYSHGYSCTRPPNMSCSVMLGGGCWGAEIMWTFDGVVKHHVQIYRRLGDLVPSFTCLLGTTRMYLMCISTVQYAP